MKAPAAPNKGLIPTLYGDNAASINRRAAIAGAAATPTAPAAARSPRVRAIGWTGRAQVAFGGRIDDGRVRWLRRFAITQDDKPYFSLEIDRLTVERG